MITRGCSAMHRERRVRHYDRIPDLHIVVLKPGNPLSLPGALLRIHHDNSSQQNCCKQRGTSKNGLRLFFRSRMLTSRVNYLQQLGHSCLTGMAPMSESLVQSIVHPEPHSLGPSPGKGWRYVPRWVQILLLLTLVGAGILI